MARASPEPATRDEALARLRSLTTRTEVAEFLGIESRTLRYLLYRLPRSSRYREFPLSKRGGGTRIIKAPIRPLKSLQRALADELLAIYRPRSCVHGYVRDRNIIQNAKQHLRKRWVLRVDLADFFPSINFGRVLGLFRALGIPEEAAVTLAQISCDDMGLPQGAPSSPIISNLICGKMDRELAIKSRENRIGYTRYSDDLIFSTNHKSFAEEIYSIAGSTLGEAIKEIVRSNGFAINSKKTSLKGQFERQLVTGVVVNEIANVPREYVRSLRSLIYCCAKYGIPAASENFFLKHDKKNRPSGKGKPQLVQIIRGRLEYVRAVKGETSTVFQSLARAWHELDDTFRLPPIATRLVVVLLEGKTDVIHFENALRVSRAAGKFIGLNLRFEERGGGSKLQSTLHNLKSNPPKELTVCLFDRDVDNVIAIAEPEGVPQRHSSTLYSATIVQPAHRSDGERLCVELLYKDAEFKEEGELGKRIYTADEFYEGGGHKSALYVTRKYPANTLIIECVYKKENLVSLTKSEFAEHIRHGRPPFQAMDVDGFVPTLKLLEALATAE